MNKELENFVREETEKLISAEQCCQEAKDAAAAWLKALGTPAEAEETAKYIKELEEDIMPIDRLIAFCGSDMGKSILGDSLAKDMLEKSLKRKAAGEKYCDCPACAACEAILSRKAELV